MDITTVAMYLCIGSLTIMAMIMIRPIIVWFIEDIKESIKDKDYQCLAISILLILVIVFGTIAVITENYRS